MTTTPETPMTDKPQLPVNPFGEWRRIPVDQTDGSPFSEILRIAGFAADDWTLSANGPFKKPGMTRAAITRHQLAEGLIHLLELGLIDIDVERLKASEWLPVGREASAEPYR